MRLPVSSKIKQTSKLNRKIKGILDNNYEIYGHITTYSTCFERTIHFKISKNQYNQNIRTTKINLIVICTVIQK